MINSAQHVVPGGGWMIHFKGDTRGDRDYAQPVMAWLVEPGVSGPIASPIVAGMAGANGWLENLPDDTPHHLYHPDMFVIGLDRPPPGTCTTCAWEAVGELIPDADGSGDPEIPEAQATVTPACAQVGLTMLRMRIAMYEEGIWLDGEEHDQVIAWAYTVAGHELSDYERSEYFSELEDRQRLA